IRVSAVPYNSPAAGAENSLFSAPSVIGSRAMTSARPIVLCVLDGVGTRDPADDNALARAQTPALDALRKRWPATTLLASGPRVGSAGPGDGETGHMVLGAGRPVPRLRDQIDQLVRANHLGRN